jgi:hypothetical protein
MHISNCILPESKMHASQKHTASPEIHREKIMMKIAEQLTAPIFFHLSKIFNLVN